MEGHVPYLVSKSGIICKLICTLVNSLFCVVNIKQFPGVIYRRFGIPFQRKKNGQPEVFFSQADYKFTAQLTHFCTTCFFFCFHLAWWKIRHFLRQLRRCPVSGSLSAGHNLWFCWQHFFPCLDWSCSTLFYCPHTGRTTTGTHISWERWSAGQKEKLRKHHRWDFRARGKLSVLGYFFSSISCSSPACQLQLALGTTFWRVVLLIKSRFVRSSSAEQFISRLTILGWTFPNTFPPRWVA